jgi:hypothetical protein
MRLTLGTLRVKHIAQGGFEPPRVLLPSLVHAATAPQPGGIVRDPTREVHPREQGPLSRTLWHRFLNHI